MPLLSPPFLSNNSFLAIPIHTHFNPRDFVFVFSSVSFSVSVSLYTPATAALHTKAHTGRLQYIHIAQVCYEEEEKEFLQHFLSLHKQLQFSSDYQIEGLFTPPQTLVLHYNLLPYFNSSLGFAVFSKSQVTIPFFATQ